MFTSEKQKVEVKPDPFSVHRDALDECLADREKWTRRLAHQLPNVIKLFSSFDPRREFI